MGGFIALVLGELLAFRGQPLLGITQTQSAEAQSRPYSGEPTSKK